MPSLLELLGQLVRAVLGAREHQHLLPVVAADQPRQQLALAIAIDRMDLLAHGVDGRVARRDLDQTRPVEQAIREALDLVGERRREQQVLPLRGQQREHALDVRQEAHVEHAVGFVEHEDLDPREIDVALSVMVEQPAGRRDEHVDAAAKLPHLRTEAYAAEHRHRGELEMLAVQPHGLLHLRCELARRRDDQRANRLARAASAGDEGRGLRGKSLQHRQHEAGSLAGAGLRAGEQVAAREHRGDRLHLDRGGLLIALFLDRAQQRIGQAE